ncbi:MAG: hypothetical protein DCC75_04575 [Proteobacteria bacterium]|nr:MAG: hypothetical protein DCC75_04575 [Pseudomonadota bacterium]
MKALNISSVGELANLIGVHRNTLQHFLAGNAVLPESINKLLWALRLNPATAFKKQQPAVADAWAPIAEVLDKLQKRYPDIAFVLFGSRATGSARKYSDFDIGVYKLKELGFEQYLQMVQLKDQLAENSPYIIDLVNLNSADEEFLRSIMLESRFITGSTLAWLELSNKFRQAK